MTVSYTSRVTKSKIGCFINVILMWKGSIYKLVYKELLIFILIYYVINFFYRFAMNDNQKRTFEELVLYCDTFVNLIPLPFVLGFFVSLIVSRWWSQFKAIPWPDELMILVNCLIPGVDEKTRMIRRTLMRYLNLTSVLIFRSISAPVKKRFPDMESVVEAGFMTSRELKSFDNLATPHSKWWLPCMWFSNLVTRAYHEKRLLNDLTLRILLMNLIDYRNKCASLYAFDWISVPLVYTQVVTLANYMYFMANLMGRQILDPRKHYSNRFDIYFPIFTFLQFLFHMGWLKVAEQLMNPFGEDEDDFEINWIIDRNFQVSMLGVDELHNSFPDLEKDVYWDEPEPDLPYTEAAKFFKRNSWMGSTADIHLTREDVNDIHKEWLSQDNLKHLIPPMNNFHEALYRFSSKSFARSRKSNQSTKSENFEQDIDNGFNGGLFAFTNHGSRNHPILGKYPSSARSSISNFQLFKQNSNNNNNNAYLTPIKEKKIFEVTQIADEISGYQAPPAPTPANAKYISDDNQSYQIKDIAANAKSIIENGVSNNNNCVAKIKKLSTGSLMGDNASITDNDLTVKGNISNLAKFHDKKMRERLLKSSAAGYVAENFTNYDTAYIKRPRSTTKDGELVWRETLSCPPQEYGGNVSRDTPPNYGGVNVAKGNNIPRALLKSLNNFGGKFKQRQSNKDTLQLLNTKDDSLAEAKNRSFLPTFVDRFTGKRKSKASFRSQRRSKRAKNKKLIMKSHDYHPFMGSKNYTVPEKRLRNRNHDDLKRASITSELKSWIMPVNRLAAPASAAHNYSTRGNENYGFDNHTSERVLKDVENTSSTITTTPNKLFAGIQQINGQLLTHHKLNGTSSGFGTIHSSPTTKRSIYRRQMSLPHNGRLLEEDEPILIATTLNNNILLTSSHTSPVEDSRIPEKIRDNQTNFQPTPRSVTSLPPVQIKILQSLSTATEDESQKAVTYLKAKDLNNNDNIEVESLSSAFDEIQNYETVRKMSLNNDIGVTTKLKTPETYTLAEIMEL